MFGLGSLFGGGNSEFVTVLDPEEYRERVSKGKVQLIDVRTAGEYQARHIKGAKNADLFSQVQFKQVVSKFDTEKPVYLYCQSGNRSKTASNILVGMGFKEIYDLRGGILGY